MDARITAATDFELIEIEAYAVERMQLHSEMDCDGGGEWECDSCTHDSEILTDVRNEMARRERDGISIDDERVGLAALGPFGREWELEQLDRQGR